jgi:hypothetical protein
MQNHSWVGIVADGAAPMRETKDTRNSTSTYVLDPVLEPAGRIRVCRVGTTLRGYHAPYDGGPWEAHLVHDRPDLPNGVHVGFTVTENAHPADLVARFDYIRFRTPTSDADCTEP